MKIKLVFIVILTLTNIWANSIVYNPPDKFDPEEYIFIGQVISHIVSTGIKPYKMEYQGLLIEVDEEIYLPEQTKKYFEVYPVSEIGTGSSGKEHIELWFPIGSKVRIVAKKTKIVFENSDELNIQLEVSPLNQFHLSLNIENVPSLISTRESIYNYENTNQDSLNNLAYQISDSLNIEDPQQTQLILHSVIYQKDFELRKDLYRLHISDDDKEKVKIIYRIKNFKYSARHRLLNIIYEYIEDKNTRRKLINSILEIELREEVDPIQWIIGR